MPTFQVASDLHLEFYGKNPQVCELIPSAPYLILAGDIGYPFQPHYQNYLTKVSTQYQKVFIISGNHEYYCPNEPHTMSEIDAKITQICQSLPNVFYLNNQSIIVDEIRLIATTLWTDISEESKDILEMSMNDYQCIYTDHGKLVTTEDTNALHNQNVTWLASELAKYPKDTIVVITHHLPSFTKNIGVILSQKVS
jgi:predicted phosphohydrolase